MRPRSLRLRELRELSLEDNAIGANGLQPALDAVEQMAPPQLCRLHVCNNPIGGAGLEILCRHVDYNDILTDVTVDYAGLAQDDVLAIVVLQQQLLDRRIAKEQV